MEGIHRRRWLGLIGGFTLGWPLQSLASQTPGFRRIGGPQVKVSLNAYSFNQSLRSGTMSLAGLLEFCARHQFDGVDLTGYYFQGYPEPPAAAELRRIKREAFLQGLAISGTGIRNDFTVTPDLLGPELARVRRWLEVARDLGAPNLRVFSGRLLADESRRPEVTRQVIECLRQCAVEAERMGVMLAIQNHFEFDQTPDHLQEILDGVASPWLGVNLDIGSFRGPAPYDEIARMARYAVAWQIKETVYTDGRPADVELAQVARILREADYRGYVLLETLAGDPLVRVPPFLDRLRAALAAEQLG